MGNQLTRINQALTGLEKCSAGVTVQQDLVEANIEGTVRDLQQKFHEILEARKRELLNRLHEISAFFLKPCTEPDVIFSAPGGVSAVLTQYGNVSSMSMVDPAKFHAMGRGLETATAGEKSTVQAVIGNGCPSSHWSVSLSLC